MKEKLFQRVIEGKCPICDRELKEKDETAIVHYNDGKLEVHIEHIKYEEK